MEWNLLAKAKFTYQFRKFKRERPFNQLPVTVPDTTVPFFNSIVTDSLLSFIKNLKQRKRRKSEVGRSC